MTAGNSDFLSAAMSIHYRTQMLEALDWDEEKLLELTDFVVVNMNAKSVDELLLLVEKKWGPGPKEVIESIVNLEKFYLNLSNPGSQDVN